jgi:serine protease Do
MRTRNILTAMVVVLGFLARGGMADETLYQQGLRSTVWIVAGKVSGSGVLVDTDQKLVVTNYHVVGNADEVQVCFPAARDGSLRVERDFYRTHLEELAVAGRVTVKDPKRDLALVQLASLPESAVAVPLAQASPTPGETVHSIGNPGTSDALWVYTSGTVRQVYEAKMRMPNGIPLVARIIETQAPVNPGDSGGPALSANGELVGIVQSYQVDAQLVSRCIDISEVQALLQGDIKTWDQRVRKALEAGNLKYATNMYGVFRLSFRDEGEEEPTLVFVDSETNRLGSSEVREVKALLYTSQNPLPVALANDLLRRNFRYTLGMWCIAESEGTYRLFFVARLDANASSPQLKDAIGHVLGVAKNEAELQAQLSAVQSVDASAVVGTWVGQLKNEKGDPVRLQIEFTAHGAFSVDDETCLTRGSYKLVEGVLQVDIRGKRQSLGPVRLRNPDQLTLDLGGGDIEFTRTSEPAALAAGNGVAPSTVGQDALQGSELSHHGG